MFINDTTSGLTFIKSKNIKVFPCGRRRSTLIDTDNNANTVSDQRHIPFDPEARLNTESNNRKHSGLNGYKQEYLNYWRADGKLSLVLAGYLFDIDLETDYQGDQSVNTVGTAIADSLSTDTESIYVNIKLADIEFFQGSSDALIDAASTQILRDQTLNDVPATCLDFLIPGANKTKIDSYYFSGLSFSNTNLATLSPDDDFVSMLLLDKVDGKWAIHEASRLPKIDHGDTKDSIKIEGDVTITNKLTVDSISLAGTSVASLAVNDLGDNTYQLQFFVK